MKRIVDHGSANNGGFKIWNKNIIIESKGYKTGKWMYRSIFIARISFFFAFSCLLIIAHFWIIKGENLIVNLFSVICLIVVALIISRLGQRVLESLLGYKKIFQWHACEHKVIHLINKNLPITFENLRKMKRISLECGTFIFTLGCSVAMLFYLAFNQSQIVRYTGQQVFYWIFAILLIMSVIFFLPSIIFQYFISTAEPTEEQLEETLRVAKEFKAKFEN